MIFMHPCNLHIKPQCYSKVHVHRMCLCSHSQQSNFFSSFGQTTLLLSLLLVNETLFWKQLSFCPVSQKNVAKLVSRQHWPAMVILLIPFFFCMCFWVIGWMNSDSMGFKKRDVSNVCMAAFELGVCFQAQKEGIVLPNRANPLVSRNYSYSSALF